MPTENRQRQPKFDRHITEKFQLKAQEAKPFLYPGISNIWELQPIGVTRLPMSVMRIGVNSFKSGFGLNLAGLRHTVPTLYNMLKDISVNETHNAISRIARGEIVQVEVEIGAEVTPTGPIRADLQIVDQDDNLLFRMSSIFNPICACNHTLKTPFMWSEELLDVQFKVSTINGVSQSINFGAKISIFPNRETSTQDGV